MVWWGEHSLADGQVLVCRIGPLRLSIHRLTHEWRVAHRRDLDDSVDVKTELGTDELDEPDTVDRFLEQQTPALCSLAPALADRSVVSRPEKPFHVPAGESTTLYVSSPVWVRVAEGEERRTLLELPAAVPSDTWFGSSTREGELCYASRTHGRLRLEDVPLRPHRAVTPVTIENRGTGHLRLERLSLPTPYLSLFAGPGDALYTEAVTLIRAQDGELARLHVGNGPSEPARGGKLLTAPRQRRAEGSLFRAFGNLF